VGGFAAHAFNRSMINRDTMFDESYVR